jgi:hypothetical protein
MIGRLTGAAIALLAGVTLAFAGDPVGTYQVAGSNPGNQNSQYAGTVTVQQTGDTYLVIWNIGSQTFVGTGVAKDNAFSVTYRSGGLTGIAMYAADGDNWQGTWAFSEGHRVGTEAWTRK